MATDQQTTRCPQCGQSFPATVRLCPTDGTVLEHQTTTNALGTVLDGKYRLDAFLSRGGMGAVYKATHVMLGKTVAVKLINPELVTTPDLVRRFQREARAATALNHPNIVSVYDLGQTPEGTLYIAMEFVDGLSLKTTIERGGPMPAARTIAILRQVASALSVAHRHGIVHRDLKPHNIMLARTDDGRDLAKLVDFGIAKTFDEATQLTMTGFALGTPQYMSPEQAEGRAVDARSDLYSLGVILYEMLSGDVPFNDASAPAILIKHVQEAPMRPSVKNPQADIPPELEAIALRCLEKDPAARFDSADAFAAALEQAASSIPGAAAALQATMPMTAVPSMPPPDATIWSASTIGATAAVAPATPASGGEPMSAKSPSDTKSTAVGSLPAAPAPPPDKSRFVLVALLVVGVAAAAGLFYWQNLSQRSAIAATASSGEAPTASPATALQAEATPQSAASTPDAASTVAPTSAPTSAPTTAPAGRADSAAPGAPAGGAALPAAAATALTPSAGNPAPRAAAGTKGVPTPGAALPTPSKPSSSSPTATRGTAREADVASPAPSRAQEPDRAPAPAVIPENPSVAFQCSGVPDICSPLRAAVDDALEKAGLTSVRSAARADIGVSARADIAQERADRQFKTEFAVRTYAIDLTAETTRSGEAVSMPGATTVSFDPQFGAERANEKARLIASEIVDRIKAFVKRKRGG